MVSINRKGSFMKSHNIPLLDGRYWLALLAASMLGTTFGDYVSEDLQFTYAGAVISFAILFGAILLFERKSPWRTIAWYWVAVVIFRSMATTLGDTISRTLNLGYGGVSLVLAIALIAFVAITSYLRSAGGFTQDVSGVGNRKTLKVDSLYWAALLIASVFGTTFGDFMWDDTGLGYGRASLVLGIVLTVLFIWDLRSKRVSDFRYWGIVAMVRTSGTAMGDFLSEGAPELGFLYAAITMVIVLTLVLAMPLPGTRKLATEEISEIRKK